MSRFALSKTQEETIERMRADDGTIRRIPGGFWTTPKLQRDTPPEWWTSIKTLRVLERLGLIERTYEFAEGWRDTRRLVDGA